MTMDQLFGAAPRQGQGADLIKNSTTATFMADVVDASHDVAVVVDFWAPWCGPCKAVEPVLAELERASDGSVAFAKVNIDENPEVPSRYDVFSIPTTILFDGGEAKETVIGARPRAHYERAWAQWLA